MSHDSVVYETKTQVAKNADGTDKFWIGRVVDIDGFICTRTETWSTTKLGGESIHQFSIPKHIHGKNIGRSNATSPREQAISEIESQLRKHQDKGYWTVGEERPEATFVAPMLAHKFNERKKDIKWPAFASPKLDGVRGLTDGKRFWSRGLKLFPEACIQHLLVDLPDGIILDGELMLPMDEYTFQESVSAVKVFDPEVSPKLEFHVFDVINASTPQLTYEQRKAIIHNLMPLFSNGFREVPSFLITSEEKLKDTHEMFVKKGYEGTMVRNARGPYKVGFRSADLLKVKDFNDAEFPVVDVVEGEANFVGAAIFVCETPEGRRFRAVPKMSMPRRRQLWMNRADIIGKQATITMQGYSDDGIPRFPRAIVVRDYE